MTARLLRKIHTYLGLLTFVNLMVYGVVGLAATWRIHPAPQLQTGEVRDMPFAAAPNLTDSEVADRVCTLLGLTLARPIQKQVIGHDAAHNLVLDFWHANGRHRVTVMETEQRLRVEIGRVPLWRYLDTLHRTTAAFRSDDWRMQLWADYNELAMWSFIGMMASGAALWLLSRPEHRMAQVSLAAGAGLFAALYFWAR
jgi:hypothetical protein